MKKELVIVAALALSLTGCASNNNYGSSPSNNVNNVRTQSVKQQSAASMNHNEHIAHLEKLATGIEGVNNAHVVILGNTAIVGLDVGADLERSRVGTIKFSVAEALRNDPYGVNAMVTADIDLSERIKEIKGDIYAGRPFTGIAEELADIVGRIVPQIPADLMPGQKEIQYETKSNTQAEPTTNKSNSNNKTYQSPEELVKDGEQKLKQK